MDDKEPRGKPQGFWLAVAMAAALILSGALGLYYWQRMDAGAAISSTGFDVAGVEESKPAAMALYRPPAAPASSPAPLMGSVQRGVAGGRSGAGAASGAAPMGARSAGEAAGPEREHERQFLRQNGAELEAYQRKLGNIGARYYKQSAVVRDVDRAFANMSRYMDLKRRYEREHDPFQFMRDAIALPEVRAEISKRMADPAVWKASFGMVLEALKDPPPPSVYKEAQRFMTKDAAVIEYMGGFAEDVQKNLSAAMAGIPAGGDITPLQKVISDIAPTGAPVPSR